MNANFDSLCVVQVQLVLQSILLKVAALQEQKDCWILQLQGRVNVRDHALLEEQVFSAAIGDGWGAPAQMDASA